MFYKMFCRIGTFTIRRIVVTQNFRFRGRGRAKKAELRDICVFNFFDVKPVTDYFTRKFCNRETTIAEAVKKVFV